MTVYEPPNNTERSLSVRALLDDPSLGLKLRLVAGAQGLERLVSHPRIQKSGLALVGHLHGIVPSRIQVLGETELSFIQSLPPERQRKSASELFALGLSLVVVTRGVDPPAVLSEEAEKTGTPLVVCAERSSAAITAVHALLDEELAPRARIHGVLIDVYEVGVLLLGRSGIGKSELALELVMRGHRLVADDAIECDYKPPGMVFGQSAPLLRYHIEVRGLGILNIKDLYGVTAVRERKRIDLVVRLELEETDADYDRLGIEDRFQEILGVPIREVMLPVRPGRNMSSIVEIAGRDELLRQAGHRPAREFIDRVDSGSMKPESSVPRVMPRIPPAAHGELRAAACGAAAGAEKMTEQTLVVVVTGLSGAGKSTGLHALEDLGFFCVDNLPPPVLVSTVEALEKGGVRRLALGVDVRVRSFLDNIGRVIDAVATGGRDLTVLFLDASDEMLLRRFSSTRRPHPLSTEQGNAALAVLDGIRIERERLSSLRARATRVVDTTRLSVHDLRRAVVDIFGPGAGGGPRMITRVVSFGFKYGAPVDADVVLDVRFLDNPFFVDDLKSLPGTDSRVKAFVLDREETRKYLEKALDLMRFSIPRFEREGKSYLTVAIGCTGGRHRSVVLADRMAEALEADLGVAIDVVHRDVAKAVATGDRQSETDLASDPTAAGGLS